jgi:hypothetical protein
MAKGQDNPNVERFGGPGSSHQDRDHPGKNKQPSGRKGGGEPGGPTPGSPTSGRESKISGGGGERDSHRTHTPKKS